ncbi:MAG: ABC transporter substrate-binding protein [Chloroflexi bacterium AL-W]|nr:ABC transporter substrate-binding protein [Chloroflexi bacterium AL-N1]NOK71528.1 ABC transporter substrate-binding protein [Chloroflexi bacterium AL-N10]NOK78874.1 ABC transporter substrate-binding protein [Chloroflexi bacterium AL-N5]NOK86350.1 ABC transporter substrate-binding protein [Chloroflexi bacterium AL-W]NOK93319.1 ABC transporter substrate-binding protein [Chloroflexi bacterium AL-N15]
MRRISRNLFIILCTTITFVLAACGGPTVTEPVAEEEDDTASTTEIAEDEAVETPAEESPTDAPMEEAATEAEEAPQSRATVVPEDTTSDEGSTEEVSANLTEGCVETYDESVDYFPEKASIEYSTGWEVEYFNNYKVINVLNPWRDADVTFQYVLVQCGTPAPEGFDDAQIVEVPIDTIVTMSTTQLPQLVGLDRVDRLIGHDDFQNINTPEVLDRIEANEMTEVGVGASTNVELLLDLEPDLVMTYGLGDPQSDVHPQLIEAGLSVALNSSYMENSPLGRAEWLKFTGAFFNDEGRAAEVFEGMATEYNALAEQATAMTDKPTVFVNAPFEGTWFMAGGKSYMAQYLADAGANYLWADDESTGSQQLSFEVVFDRAADADFWVNTSIWTSLDEALAADERFGDFAAFQNGTVYNNNARLNNFGGNDYWETGVSNPQLVLADLIKIFHPDLLPNHELYFYQQLPQSSEGADS